MRQTMRGFCKYFPRTISKLPDGLQRELYALTYHKIQLQKVLVLALFIP